MCTLSWFADGDGFQLFFSRDERATRTRSWPPRELLAGGVRAVAPIDGEAGGTWIGASELGVALCLLNRYPDPAPPAPGSRSRGLLVRDLLGAASVEDAGARLARANLSRYRPFTLVAFGRGGPPGAVAWDGVALRTRELGRDEHLLVSVGERAAERERSRRSRFAAFLDGPGGSRAERLLAFHRAHDPADPAAGPCVHGERARTVSLTTVSVSAAGVRLTHALGAPCEHSAATLATLALVAPVRAGGR